MASKLTQLVQEMSSLNMRSRTRESQDWLLRKIANIRNPRAIARAITNEKFRQVNRFVNGGLYCFFYDPKTKNDLPYWDAFPMVIVLQKDSDGFLGLNLHYLPPKVRLAFLQKLSDFAVYDDNNEIKRVKVTYDILSASKRYREFRPCIKKYLYSQLQSRILAIEPEEWEAAIFLPLQQFQKERTQTIWKESREEMKD